PRHNGREATIEQTGASPHTFNSIGVFISFVFGLAYVKNIHRQGSQSEAQIASRELHTSN
ncbi:unnamed protein product, partial [Musa acuminata var. zebrina]